MAVSRQARVECAASRPAARLRLRLPFIPQRRRGRPAGELQRTFVPGRLIRRQAPARAAAPRSKHARRERRPRARAHAPQQAGVGSIRDPTRPQATPAARSEELGRRAAAFSGSTLRARVIRNYLFLSQPHRSLPIGGILSLTLVEEEVVVAVTERQARQPQWQARYQSF